MADPAIQAEAATEGSFARFRNEIPEPTSEGGQESTGSTGARSYSSETDPYATETEPEQFVVVVDGVGDFDSIDFGTLTEAEVNRFEFADLQAAYEFYNEYGRVKGFSVRHSKIGRSKKAGSKREILWKIFVCSCEGEREGKYMQRGDRKMDVRPITRCGCSARIKVHIDHGLGRWYVEYFSDTHNHELLDWRFRGLMRSHRKVKDGDMHQINSMRKAGMRVPTIFQAFANQTGGFETVGFELKDIYNAIDRQRRAGASDAECALQYLATLKKHYPSMFWKYSLDDERRLHNIFWCDGTSQHDFSIFGDVLGFDATYGRNRYKCPLVIFSGVDHRMRTIVFGCAILSNESKESYVWLLQGFLEAMKGKQPLSVITDGDLAMKNAINAIFPEASHRLCSWHLLRNATRRVGMPRFLRKFRVCLMGDIEVDEFESIWNQAVEEFGLEEHNWVMEMYERKELWSNAHIRGKFFAGLKTTSRCEALNMQIGKFIHNGYNLREFIEHFQHHLEFMRRRELVADYRSKYGVPVSKTRLEEIETYAATVYTKEVFNLFREVLMLASNVRVVSSKKTSTSVLFEVGMYRQHWTWTVAWNEEEDDFRCSCLRMESFRIPCVHIIGVLVSLDITIIPSKLVLQRWTNTAKQPKLSEVARDGEIPDLAYMSMHAAMLDDCRELVRLSCHSFQDYFEVKRKIAKEREALLVKQKERMDSNAVGEDGPVRDPARARHKGCGRKVQTTWGRFRRVQRCRKCGKAGHNARRCEPGRADETGAEAFYDSQNMETMDPLM